MGAQLLRDAPKQMHERLASTHALCTPSFQHSPGDSAGTAPATLPCTAPLSRTLSMSYMGVSAGRRGRGRMRSSPALMDADVSSSTRSLTSTKPAMSRL